MKISYNWLKEYVDINVTPEKLAELLTMHSFEIESMARQDRGLEDVVVGEVMEKRKHPDADKLSVVKVKIREEGSWTSKEEVGPPMLEIVCGAPNIDVGQKVPVALLGAELPCGLKIEKRKVRGVYSCGMVCAEDELGLSDKHSEIIALDKDAKVGAPAKDTLGLDDAIFETAILPNRGHDLLSHIGVAREAAALLNEKLKTKNEKLDKKISNSSDSLKVEVENSDLCRRYSAAIVRNVQVKESPKWLQKRLESVGVRSINNIVDITNYVMFSLGQPMHAFDADKLNGKIIVRKAKKGEKIVALDDKTYELSEGDLVIADEEHPIAIAGVMGGSETAVDESTKNIIFESANFQGHGIRKTSERLKLASESSYRFEREIDPELTMKALEISVKMIKETAGGEIESEIVDIYPVRTKEKTIRFNFDRIEKLIGIKIDEQRVKEILESLEFGVTEIGENLEVKVPTFRLDVERVNDVIEEIGRIYGYNNVPEVPARIDMTSVRQEESMELDKKTRFIMEGLGFAETYNYSFISESYIRNVGLETKDHSELENPLSEEFKYLRTSLAPGLLKNTALNLKFKNGVRLFETGRAFFKGEGALPVEKKMLGIVMAEDGKNNLFYVLKGKIEVLFDKLGLEKCAFQEIKDTDVFWHKGRSAEISMGKKIVAKIGELHPKVLAAFGIESRVAYFEMILDDVAPLLRSGKKFKKINHFPSAELDLAIIFDEKINWDEIRRLIMKADNRIIKNVETFDVYRGEGLEVGTKSVAFRITYQADDGTLTDEEVKKVQEKVIKALEEIGGEIRK